MSEKKQHKNIIITAACTTLVVAVVAVIGAMSIKQEPETIQGQVEVSEYRVSSKVPGRILEIRVKEGHTGRSRSTRKDDSGTVG